METSPSIKELANALCQFQAATIKVTKGKTNPAFKSKYSDINSVLDAVLPALTEVGVSVLQFPDGEALTTRLMHTSGEWMQASYTLKAVQATPQAWGSAITYARRYALISILGLGSEDDDGQAASAPAPAKQAAAPAPTATPVVYATAAQKEEIMELIKTDVIQPDEFTKIMAAIPKLTETQATGTIAKLKKTISERAGGVPV